MPDPIGWLSHLSALASLEESIRGLDPLGQVELQSLSFCLVNE